MDIRGLGTRTRLLGFYRFHSRDMNEKGYYCRHFNWMGHMLYREAFKFRLAHI